MVMMMMMMVMMMMMIILLLLECLSLDFTHDLFIPSTKP